MLKFHADLYYSIGCTLHLWIEHAERHQQKNPKGTLAEDDTCLPSYQERLPLMISLCRQAGLKTSARQLERLRDAVLSSNCRYKALRDMLDTAHSVIRDELESNIFLYLPSERTEYYTEKNLFGEQVAEKFPSAIRDIEHAGKCLALGEATACVFHLMRVMEVGLKALARALRIPYAPSWESYLTQIKTKVGEKHKTKGIKWKRDEPFFKEVLGDLLTVKIAWRNPTMHIVRSYDTEEAEEIFRAVRGFVKRLAAH